jgi:quinol monooxygenase YgiN
MKTRSLLALTCLLSLGAFACAGSSEETGVGTETTPAAAAGEPTTAEPAVAPAPGAATEPAPAAEPAPATPAANPQPAPAAQMPGLGVVITHKVKDYDAWKTAFDGHVQARKDAGIAGHGLMRDTTNDKQVSIWLPATDEAKLKAFMDSKDLKAKMKEAGVIGAPKVVVMKPVAAKMDPTKTGLSAGFVTVKVKDFDAFKAAFEAGAAALETAGIVGWGLGQDTTNAKTAYLHLQSDDAAKVKAYVEAADTKKAWKEAGVIGAAKASYVKEEGMQSYQ